MWPGAPLRHSGPLSKLEDVEMAQWWSWQRCIGPEAVAMASSLLQAPGLDE